MDDIKTRREMVKKSLCQYGITDFKMVPFPHLDPLPVSVRTFKSSNFLVALRAFKEKRIDADEAKGGLAGKLPNGAAC